MSIATFLLICVFILLLTGWMDRLLRRIRLDKGLAAAGTLLVLALTAFPFEIGFVSVFPAFLFLLIAAGGRCRQRSDFLLAVAASLICGVAGWLLNRIALGFAEPGLLLSLPQVLIGCFLIRRERASTMCCALTPLILGLLLTVEELLAFGEAELMLGSRLLMDIQVCGIVVSLLFGQVRLYGQNLYRLRKGGIARQAKNDT